LIGKVQEVQAVVQVLFPLNQIFVPLNLQLSHCSQGSISQLLLQDALVKDEKQNIIQMENNSVFLKTSIDLILM
jgi:hypothetical protein